MQQVSLHFEERSHTFLEEPTKCDSVTSSAVSSKEWMDSAWRMFSRPGSWQYSREPDHRFTAVVGRDVVALEPELVKDP